MLNEYEISTISNTILSETLGSSGFDHSVVELTEDADGEAAIFVTAHFRPTARVADPRLSLDARVRLMDAIRETGDIRFPYLRYFYPDDVRPSEERKDAAE